MEVLKTCLFCGKYVDTTFLYCPHCGYEFGGDNGALRLVDEGSGAASDGTRGADYLIRLRTLERLLGQLEAELDVLLSDYSALPRSKISVEDP